MIPSTPKAIAKAKQSRKEKTAELVARCQNATACWVVPPSPEAMGWFTRTVLEDLFELHYAEKLKQESAVSVIGESVA